MIASCPFCSNNFYVTKDKLGTTVACAKCNRSVQIAQAASQTTVQTPTPPRANSMHNKRLCEGVNLSEGFKRLVLVTSFAFGPIVWVVIKAKDLYTINASFSEPIDNSLRFLILWAIGFASVWAYYVGAVLLVKCFGIGRFRRERKRVLRPLLALTFVSLLPLIPALIETARYIAASNSMWYYEEIFKFFLPWPAAGFAAVWGSYLVAVFVGNGFRYRYSEQIIQDMQRFEPGIARPELQTTVQSWRGR